MDKILNAIPHRPPFLFVDEIVEQTQDSIHTRKQVRLEEPFFKGHYPDYPIMPGVLLLECLFQAGAILMSKRFGFKEGGVPVITRVQNVKFKNAVVPGDLLEVSVTYSENVGPAHYMKGKATTNGKTVVTAEFTTMLIEEAP